MQAFKRSTLIKNEFIKASQHFDTFGSVKWTDRIRCFIEAEIIFEKSSFMFKQKCKSLRVIKQKSLRIIYSKIT